MSAAPDNDGLTAVRRRLAAYWLAFGEDRAVVTLVACSDGAGRGWL
jgi:hypothetical protein